MKKVTAKVSGWVLKGETEKDICELLSYPYTKENMKFALQDCMYKTKEEALVHENVVGTEFEKKIMTMTLTIEVT